MAVKTTAIETKRYQEKFGFPTLPNSQKTSHIIPVLVEVCWGLSLVSEYTKKHQYIETKKYHLYHDLFALSYYHNFTTYDMTPHHLLTTTSLPHQIKILEDPLENHSQVHLFIQFQPCVQQQKEQHAGLYCHGLHCQHLEQH